MKRLHHPGIWTFGLAGMIWLALSAAAWAQVEQTTGPLNPHRNRGPQPPYMQQQQQQYAQPQPQPAPAAPASNEPAAIASTAGTTAVLPSLLDKPAQPARIDLGQGQLSIHADNSSLIDIMHRLTADAGMTIDGLNKDQRVFGTYGPGDPQDVISQLLDGTGYNVVMLGRTDAGTPKQVTLTPRAGGVSNGASPMRAEPMNQINSEDDDVEDEPQPPQPVIINPPVENQQPSGPPGGARTPQQMLQELQQMRQQQMLQMQQQQQQNQPQPPPPQQQ